MTRVWIGTQHTVDEAVLKIDKDIQAAGNDNLHA